MKNSVWLLLAVTACAGAPESPPGIDLVSARLIDLSYTYGDETLYWPTSPTSFELDKIAEPFVDGLE